MKNRITDHEAELLLAGRTPAGRPDFGELAASVASFRSAALEAAPRPSAALTARLGLPPQEVLSALATSSDASSGRLGAGPPADVIAARGSRSGVVRRAVERVSGLGLTARIAAGVGALALGITVTGVAGALPGGMQDAFDELVSTVISIRGDVDAVVVDEPPLEEPADDERGPAGPTPAGEGRDAGSSSTDDSVPDEADTASEIENPVEAPGSGAGAGATDSGTESGSGSGTTRSGAEKPSSGTQPQPHVGADDSSGDYGGR